MLKFLSSTLSCFLFLFLATNHVCFASPGSSKADGFYSIVDFSPLESITLAHFKNDPKIRDTLNSLRDNFGFSFMFVDPAMAIQSRKDQAVLAVSESRKNINQRFFIEQSITLSPYYFDYDLEFLTSFIGVILKASKANGWVVKPNEYKLCKWLCNWYYKGKGPMFLELEYIGEIISYTPRPVLQTPPHEDAPENELEAQAMIEQAIEASLTTYIEEMEAPPKEEPVENRLFPRSRLSGSRTPILSSPSFGSSSVLSIRPLSSLSSPSPILRKP